jgi:hypothetical protein
MPVPREEPIPTAFNTAAQLPYNLRLKDFELAMQDVYDFFHDVNKLMLEKNLERFDDTLRPAIMSGLLSDMLTASLANHSRSLTQNCYFNGHPDLVVKGAYPNDCIKAGEEGIEIKTTRKAGGAVDTHGARNQWMCVFVYQIDNVTQPARSRAPMKFTEVYLGQVTLEDFRRNERGQLGTRTATLHGEGIAKLRQNWIYRVNNTHAADR